MKGTASMTMLADTADAVIGVDTHTGTHTACLLDRLGKQVATITVPADPRGCALGSSAGESARLQRQADELAPDSAALLDRVGCGRGRARSTWGAARGGLLTCWPGGCHRAAGSWALTPTRRTPPGSSPAGR
jgi:hypothetical protein